MEQKNGRKIFSESNWFPLEVERNQHDRLSTWKRTFNRFETNTIWYSGAYKLAESISNVVSYQIQSIQNGKIGMKMRAQLRWTKKEESLSRGTRATPRTAIFHVSWHFAVWCALRIDSKTVCIPIFVIRLCIVSSISVGFGAWDEIYGWRKSFLSLCSLFAARTMFCFDFSFQMQFQLIQICGKNFVRRQLAK